MLYVHVCVVIPMAYETWIGTWKTAQETFPIFNQKCIAEWRARRAQGGTHNEWFFQSRVQEDSLVKQTWPDFRADGSFLIKTWSWYNQKTIVGNHKCTQHEEGKRLHCKSCQPFQPICLNALLLVIYWLHVEDKNCVILLRKGPIIILD